MSNRVSCRRRSPQLRVVIAALSIGLVASACGSSVPHETLEAAWNQGGSVQPGGGVASGGTSAAGGSSGVGASSGSTASGGSSATPGAGGTGGTVPGAVAGADPAAGGGAVVGGGGAAAAACTGSEAPIVLGNVGTYSSIVGGLVGTAPQTLQAWAASVNAVGGINCHEVEVVVADDGGDPSRHQALVQQLVEERNVIAFVGDQGILTGTTAVSYLTERQVPVIGENPAVTWGMYESPMYFPQQSMGISYFRVIPSAIADFAIPRDLTRLGVATCIEAAVCTEANRIAGQEAAAAGLTMAYQTQFSLTQPDYTATCQAARNAGVQVFYVILDPSGLQRLARNCRNIGYTPQLATSLELLTPDVVSDPNLEGMIAAIGVKPWTLTSDPAVAEFLSVMEQYAPGVLLGGVPIQTWVSAQIFQTAAENTTDPTTSTGILEGLATINNNDFGGLTAPMTYTAGQPAPRQSCYWTIQNQGGTYQALSDGQRTCI